MIDPSPLLLTIYYPLLACNIDQSQFFCYSLSVAYQCLISLPAIANLPEVDTTLQAGAYDQC